MKVIYTNAQGKKKSFECHAFDVKDTNAECCVLSFLGEQVGENKERKGKKTVVIPTHKVLGREYGVTSYKVVEE